MRTEKEKFGKLRNQTFLGLRDPDYESTALDPNGSGYHSRYSD